MRPPQAAHLQGIHEVLDQEEASHLLQAAVDVGQTGVHVLAEGLGGNTDVHIYQRSAEQEAAEGEGECGDEAVCQKNRSFWLVVGAEEASSSLCSSQD